MTGKDPDPVRFGNSIVNLVASGMNLDAMGRFVCMDLGCTHPYLTPLEFGRLMSNLVQSQANSESIGRFVLLELGAAFKTNSEQPNSRHQEEAPYSAVPTASDGGMTHQDLRALIQVEIADSMKMVLAAGTKAKATSDRIKLKLRIHGQETSLFAPMGLFEAFVEAFGTKRLRQLLNEVGATPGAPGVTRTFRVQQQMDALLAQRQQVVYPHGIKVIQGGQGDGAV